LPTSAIASGVGVALFGEVSQRLVEPAFDGDMKRRDSVGAGAVRIRGVAGDLRAVEGVRLGWLAEHFGEWATGSGAEVRALPERNWIIPTWPAAQA